MRRLPCAGTDAVAAKIGHFGGILRDDGARDAHKAQRLPSVVCVERNGKGKQ